MNKYLQSIIVLAIVFLFEIIPFLYNETYTLKDMKWGWIVGIPLVLLVRNILRDSKRDKK